MTFHALANLADLHDGYSRAFKLKGRSLLLIQEEGRHFLIENRCPHMDAPLANGKVHNGLITCRAHGISFCLLTGAAQGSLAGVMDRLTQLEVAYDGNKIGVVL